tara:strand:+ start:113 stop:1621 length:1509 start_codon:yes stop_codon:yes gene_type:complete
MKILNQSQIREADHQTINREPIPSIALMERAAKACIGWLVERYDKTQSFCIICGTGNNGGDGLAIYRLLAEKKYPCKLFEFPLDNSPSKDFIENRKKIKIGEIKKLTLEALCSLPEEVILIDALLGTGVNRPVKGILKRVIQELNKLPNTILSIDIPSGLFPEFNSENYTERIVQANHTLSFQLPKLAFLLPEKGGKTGEFHLLDINLSPSFLDEVKTPYNFLTSKIANTLYKSTNKFDHKGTNGHHLLIAGSKGKIGAAILAAKAALRTGLGKLSILTPLCGVEILQNNITEAMIELNTGNNCLSGYYGLNFDTVSLGPGLGTSADTKDFLHSFFTKTKVRMVIDADAINLIALNPKWIKKLQQKTILTPHPKEFERLVGPWEGDKDKLERLIDFVKQNQLICVLKGAHTAIALPDGNIWFNSSGNTGMASAGSGDVLTGIIGGLLAKGYTPENAALLGVYAHGRAADIQTQSLSPPFMLASDIIDGLNDVWKEMENLAKK